MDISASIAPNSEQVNADDLIGGPRIVTVENVTAGTPEQPVFIQLAEFPGRSYRPSKTMRRILIAAWGPEASAYVGRRMMLYRDGSVRFGGAEVGGIRISALSHIDKRMTVALSVSRGKRAPFTIEPLTEAATQPAEIANFEELIAAADSIERLDAIAAELKAAKLGAGGNALRAAWTARKAVIETPADEDAVLDDAREADE